MKADLFFQRNEKHSVKIAVVGDGMVDQYYEVNAERVSPEFPIPVMQKTDGVPTSICPGGAGNVCAQFKHFNVEVLYFGFLDSAARTVYEQSDIATYMSVTPGIKGHVPLKKRFYQGDFPLCRLDIEAPNYGLSKNELVQFQHKLYESYSKVPKDVTILSDYGKGVFSDDGWGTGLWTSDPSDPITIVDPKGGPVSRWKGCTIIKPNDKEAAALSGESDWRKQCRYFQKETDCQAVVITQGGLGVVGVVGGREFEYRPQRGVKANSVIGAGDCFVAFLAMGMAHCIDLVDVAELAFEAGSLYVQKKHNEPITPREVLRHYDPIEAKIVKREQLQIEGKKVGFTSGAFDILHAGHVDCLQRAKQLCDVLVVGINSDSSIKSYKGENRPIIPEDERIRMVAALDCVDYAFLFNERRNRTNLETLKPDLYIKAGDYKEDELTSRDTLQAWGGKAVILPLVQGLSTTNIVEKIQSVPIQKTGKRGPAIFLDRDGTINKHIQYLHEPEKFEFLPGAVEAIKELYDMQYKIVIVTNQPGIGLGYFTKEDLFDVNSKMLKGLSAAGILVQKIYFCPHSNAEQCECRKPKPGMLLRAAEELNIDLEHSFMIGDSETDAQAAAAVGVRSILLKDPAIYEHPECGTVTGGTACVLNEKNSVSSAMRTDWPGILDWIKSQEV
jgi:D-beta-D-heptose 7-phosphate kinase/D-beta-D-heptose 1-phosphate adenosyltransferase